MSDGEGCTCFASYVGECVCDADWTSHEVYELRAENEKLKAELAEAKKDAELCIDFETFAKLISDPMVSIKSGGKSIKKELLEAMKGK